MYCAVKGYCAERIVSCIVVWREFPLCLCAFTVGFAIKFVLNGFDLAVGFRVVFVLNGFSVVVWALSLCSMGSI